MNKQLLHTFKYATNGRQRKRTADSHNDLAINAAGLLIRIREVGRKNIQNICAYKHKQVNKEER
jgi:hypothetical protein